jgi:hypothetical protein
MAYYDALVARWATLAGTTAEKLAAINALTIAGPMTDVTVAAVVATLALSGKLAGLQAYAQSPPSNANAEALVAARELVALLSSPNAPPFRMSDPTVYATIQNFLAALVADAATGIGATDEAALLSLAATTVPWWKANGYASPISQGDLDAAGGLV